MDAYDIFKKLTKGLTFKQKVLGVKNNDRNKNGKQQKDENVKIKDEESGLSENEEFKSEKSDSEHSESKNEVKSEDESEDGNDIQLMKGVTIGEKKTKKKKAKTEDLQKKLEIEEDRNKNGKQQKDENIKIKDEESGLSENEEFKSEKSDSEHSESKNEVKSEDESEDGNDIQLMKGVTIGEKKTKKKKAKTEDLQKKLEIEEQNRFRNLHSIKTVGRHVPAALQDFTELVSRYSVTQGLVDIVTSCGYTEPTPVQRQAMPCMLEDRQILACAPTGSGKTAAFLIPLLHTLGAPQGGPRALVLCPTRELAHQIYREALRLSASTELRCSVVKNMKESKVKEREATIRKSDIVISTPNRICYLLNRDNVSISLEKVKWLVIDEADKLFEGSIEEQSDFRQQMEQILTACGNPKRRIAMFSATHTPSVAKWTRHNMRGLINITVGQRNAATNLVEQELLYCGNENGKLVAFRQLVQKGIKPPVLVFVQSKDRAKQLFKELIYDGINVDVIHADRTQTQRDNVVRSFRVGRIWVLICTEVVARGLDFRGVNLVLNYDFPPSAIAYIHRVGRAGRAGQKGKAITFFTQDDVSNLRSIASVIKQSGCEVPEYMLKLKQNPNKRKILVKKAPHRDKISTILDRKRKLDTKNPNEKTKDTDAIKTGKNKKNRKVENENKRVKSQKEKPLNKGKQNDSKKLKKLQKKSKNVVHKKVKNVNKISKKNK